MGFENGPRARKSRPRKSQASSSGPRSVHEGKWGLMDGVKWGVASYPTAGSACLSRTDDPQAYPPGAIPVRGTPSLCLGPTYPWAPPHPNSDLAPPTHYPSQACSKRGRNEMNQTGCLGTVHQCYSLDHWPGLARNLFPLPSAPAVCSGG